MPRKFRKNQKVEFRHLSSLTGKEHRFTGVILGFGDAVRKMWPDEMAEAPDEMLLVWRADYFGNEQHFAVLPEDVVDEKED